MLDWVSLLVGTGRVALRSRQALVVENLLLRQQLAVTLRARRRPNVRWHDRLFWVVERRLVTDWRRHLVLVQPETGLRWHRQGWRLLVVALPEADRTATAGARSAGPDPSAVSRATAAGPDLGYFLRNHAHATWAADLLTVQTLTLRTLYVLFFISHGRRELIRVAVTAHPTAAWVWR